jgi:hypothetical protein
LHGPYCRNDGQTCQHGSSERLIVPLCYYVHGTMAVTALGVLAQCCFGPAVEPNTDSASCLLS